MRGLTLISIICMGLINPSIGQEENTRDTLGLHLEKLRSTNQRNAAYASWLENLNREAEKSFETVLLSEDSSGFKGFEMQQSSSMDGCEEYSSNLTVTQFNALIDLYESTTVNSNWTISTGWDTAVRGVVEDVRCWYGVKINSLGELNSVRLDRNNLNGTLPPNLGDISNLATLVISNNPLLTGSIPESIGKMTNLVYFNAALNNHTGSLPDSLGFNTEMKNLTLYANPNLGGSLPESLGNLTLLEIFRLDRTSVGGTIPEIFGNMPHLVTLVLSNNEFTGPIPSQYHSQSNLVTLNLSRNNLTGNIPATIGSLSHLGSLRLEDNALSGTVPASLGNLSGLKELFLTNNLLNGIALDFSGMTSLLRLHLSENNFTGNLPVSIFALDGLEELMFFDNQFSGSFPDPSQMLSLESLAAYGNFLSGTLHPGLANLNKLRYFNIGYNQFTGNIPPNMMCHSDWIGEFNVNSNPELHGELPECIANGLFLVNLNNSAFNFEDIIPVKERFTGALLKYELQNKVDTARNVSSFRGFPLSLEAKIDRNTTTPSFYKWYKRGSGGTEIPMHVDSTVYNHTLFVDFVAESDEGTYFYKIWNPAAPGLTLISRDVTLSVVEKAPLNIGIGVLNIYCGKVFIPVIPGDEDCSPVAVSFSWNFGDGNSTSDRMPVHQFASSGTYSVDLEVSYRCGASSVFTAGAMRNVTESILNSIPEDLFVDSLVVLQVQASQKVIQATAATFSDVWNREYTSSGILDKNSYANATSGVWRNASQLYYDVVRDAGDIPDISKDGGFTLAGFNWQYPELETVSNWNEAHRITSYSTNSQPEEGLDVLGIYSGTLYSYREELLVAQGANTRAREMAFHGFEPGEGANSGNWRFEHQEIPKSKTFKVVRGSSYFGEVDVPIGELADLDTVFIITFSGFFPRLYRKVPVLCVQPSPENENFSVVVLGHSLTPGFWTGQMIYYSNAAESSPGYTPDERSHSGKRSLKVEGTKTYAQDLLSLQKGKSYHFSSWVSVGSNPEKPFIEGGVTAKLVFRDSEGVAVGDDWVVYPSGSVVEGWQQLKGDFKFPNNATTFDLSFSSGTHSTLWVDDLRLFPTDANMQSYVYDYANHRLAATLDAENFGTFYYYDDEGNLRLVKKETVSGIVTLSETEQYMIEE